MPTFRLALALLFTFALALPGQAQDNKTFPTNNEIQLLLTQTDRAIQQYIPVIDGELRISNGGAEAAATDRKIVHALETAVKALKIHPQMFNGAAGFAFFEWLDDASRNAALCASAANTESAKYLMAGDASKAEEMIHLSQSSTDISTLIYTVSENAGSLYERYLKAEESLAQRCADDLKRVSPAKK
jgi:hypothetical protein